MPVGQTRYKRLAFLATASMTGATPGALHAQSTATAPEANRVSSDTEATPPAQDTSSGLADIVVTAQHRSENMQRVPIAVTAQTGVELQSKAITNTMQLGVATPSLNIRTVSGTFNPYLRGIGTTSNTVENPVALYIDGVYIPQQREGIRELNDIDQLAVLKGPQGTLFGRNATGGVIQITTRAPSETYRGEVGAEIDNYATIKTDAYLTGPISEELRFSLSGQFAKQYDGYGHNFTLNDDTYYLQHEISLRGKLQFEPGPDTRLTLIADYLDHRSIDNGYRPLLGTQYALPGFGPSQGRYDTYEGTRSNATFQGGGISLALDQNLGSLKLSAISAYRKGKSSFLQSELQDPANSFLVSFPDNRNESFSQEIRILSQPGKFNWVIGGFYFHNEFSINPGSVFFSGVFTPTPGSVTQVDYFGKEVTDSLAPFGQFNWELLPRLTLTGGVRWSYERRKADLSQLVALKNGLAFPGATTGKITSREPTFRAALSYQVDDNTLGYLSFNTGFKSGGFNVTNPFNPPYLMEKINAYEAGLKTELLDRRLRFNIAGYYYDYSNIQVARYSNGVALIYNGASAKLYGVDLYLKVQLTNELQLSGGLALEHATFKSFPGAQFGVRQPDGSILLVNGDAAGKRLPLAQNVQGMIGLDYERDVAMGKLGLNVTAAYNGSYFFEPDNVIRQAPYTMLNATLRLTLPGDRLSFSLFGRNLLNETIIASPTTQSFGYDVRYAPPRTYGVSARLKM